MSDYDFLRSVGGKLISHGRDDAPGEPRWNFGLMLPEDRDDEQQRLDAELRAEMPRFQIDGTDRFAGEKACLFDFWRHPDTVKALGFEFPGVHQLTGSCVGAGGGNVLFSLLAVEVIRHRDPEQIVVPFWLLPYGWSRYFAGMKRRGEGSWGTTFAKACREVGVLDAKAPGLPPFQNSDGLVWGSGTELEWSDGDDQPRQFVDAAKVHLVKTTAQCRNADDVRAAIVNGYPCTVASDYAFKAGVQDGVLLARHQGSWAHQMSYQAWWDHPVHGEIFWEHNQWGKRAHGICPTGAPPGGAWVKKKDVEYCCRQNEVFAFSQFSGLPAQTIPWDELAR